MLSCFTPGLLLTDAEDISPNGNSERWKNGLKQWRREDEPRMNQGNLSKIGFWDIKKGSILDVEIRRASINKRLRDTGLQYFIINPNKGVKNMIEKDNDIVVTPPSKDFVLFAKNGIINYVEMPEHGTIELRVQHGQVVYENVSKGKQH